MISEERGLILSLGFVLAAHFFPLLAMADVPTKLADMELLMIAVGKKRCFQK